MFYDCENLNYIKCLATDKSSYYNCLGNWVKGVASTGTFIKYPGTSWSRGESDIPWGWTVYDATL